MNLSPAVAEELDVDFDEQGVVVAEVQPRSAARRVGIRSGDIIVEINGREIDTTRTLETVNARRVPVWDIILSRKGRLMRFSLRG
jgi:S1-C subfamily serine protease